MVFEARDLVQSIFVSSFFLPCCWFSIPYELFNNETIVKCYFVESGAVGLCWTYVEFSLVFIDSILEKSD